MSIFKKVFGSRNKRELKRLGPMIDKIASLKETMEAKMVSVNRGFSDK